MSVVKPFGVEASLGAGAKVAIVGHAVAVVVPLGIDVDRSGPVRIRGIGFGRRAASGDEGGEKKNRNEAKV